MAELLTITIALSITLLSMLLGATLYESVVMAPNYARGIEALKNVRAFLTAANPARYFRFLSPLTQALLLLSAVLSWAEEPIYARWFLLIALGALICTDVITFTYHYPRNKVMFVLPLDRPSAELQKVAREWAKGNYVRMGLLVVSVIGAFTALYSLFSRSGI